MARMSRGAVPAGAALLALGWGSNQFAPLVVGYQVEAGLDPTAAQTVFVLYAVGLVPGLFAGGHLSDRHGRPRLVRLALALSVVSSLLLLLGGQALALLDVARLLAGFASGIGFSAGTAWVKEKSADAHGARHAVIAMTAGFALGALVAGSVAAAGLGAGLGSAYLPHLVVTLVALVLAWRVGPSSQTLPTASSPAARTAPGSDRAGSPSLLDESGFWVLVLPLAPWVFLNASVALAVLPGAVPSTWGGSALWSAAVLTPLPAVAGVAAQPLAARLAGLRSQTVSGLVASAVGLGTGALAVVEQSLGLVAGACLLLGAAYGLCQTAGLHAVNALSPPGRLGQSTAIYQALTYVGYLAPLPIVTLARFVDLATVLAVLAGAALLVGAAAATRTVTAPARTTAVRGRKARR